MDTKVQPKKRITFNPLEGRFDVITDNNWAYKSVPEDKKLNIPGNQQMKLCGELQIDGCIEVEGDLIIEE